MSYCQNPTVWCVKGPTGCHIWIKNQHRCSMNTIIDVKMCNKNSNFQKRPKGFTGGKWTHLADTKTPTHMQQNQNKTQPKIKQNKINKQNKTNKHHSLPTKHPTTLEFNNFFLMLKRVAGIPKSSLCSAKTTKLSTISSKLCQIFLIFFSISQIFLPDYLNKKKLFLFFLDK